MFPFPSIVIVSRPRVVKQHMGRFFVPSRKRRREAGLFIALPLTYGSLGYCAEAYCRAREEQVPRGREGRLMSRHLCLRRSDKFPNLFATAGEINRTRAPFGRFHDRSFNWRRHEGSQPPCRFPCCLSDAVDLSTSLATEAFTAGDEFLEPRDDVDRLD